MGAVVMRITVVYAASAQEVREAMLELPDGATAAQALAATGWPVLPRLQQAGPDGLTLGVWGRKADLSTPLRDRDRVELYRPLLVDPKVARRERFQRQGAKAAGLFASKRPGAKSGY